ncbi:MAG: hypothetical protein WBQ13_10830 [Terriglobales bacterium]
MKWLFGRFALSGRWVPHPCAPFAQGWDSTVASAKVFAFALDFAFDFAFVFAFAFAFFLDFDFVFVFGF